MKNKDITDKPVSKGQPEAENPYDLFNYCDYRCDRCDYAPECPVYQEEARFRLEERSWPEVLEENLKKTAGLLQAIKDEDGLNFAPDSDEYELEYQKMREEVDTRLPNQLANRYMEAAMAFLKSYSPGYLVLSRLDEAATDLGSYATILPVKVQRTLISLSHLIVEEIEFHLVDAFLTSQVVYKALNKSLAAVEILRDVLEQDTGDLDELEDLLNQLRSAYWHEFPVEIVLFLIKTFQSNEGTDSGRKGNKAGKKAVGEC